MSTPTVPTRPTPAPAREWTARSQPEALRARGLSAILRVRDVARTLDWYRDVLRVTVQRRYERGGVLVAATLVAGSVRLVIEQDDSTVGSGRDGGEAFPLWLTTTQDLDLLAVGIEARGGVVDRAAGNHPWGMRSFSIVDPDGRRLTLAQGF